MLLAGTVDIGRAVWIQSTLGHAAREGARFAATRSAESAQPASEEQIVEFVRNRAVGVPSTEVAVTVAWSPANAAGGVVTVSTSHQYVPLLGALLSLSAFDLDASAAMTIL